MDRCIAAAECGTHLDVPLHTAQSAPPEASDEVYLLLTGYWLTHGTAAINKQQQQQVRASQDTAWQGFEPMPIQAFTMAHRWKRNVGCV